MSFWGHLVVARDERPLPELYTMRPYRRDVACTRVRADDWQVCALRSGAAVPDTVRLLVELSAETHAPALLASVADGDCASVEGFSTDGYWQAWPRTRGRGGAGEEPSGEVCAHEAAARAAGWAAAAGRRVDAAPIAALLSEPADRRADVFFEDLLTLLGIDAAPAPAAQDRRPDQRVSRKRSRTRVPNRRPSTGTRSSTPWNMPR
ncbi:hypothetical protein Arub01_53110 [Actinomadura rubrobrunea]|uniref:Uncharacterized protein n=1 Tax=Actinomadura rubrobrunea TaxID=115335 RepID=A0A9W6UYC6_9ACTN|nr:hypothetical protein [Actinomadura rubrobrunea]GLW67068.1 hypothetical protein Arub01_53110 [Actinomadura rubrobrunea]